MTAPSFERLSRVWVEAMQRPPLDEQRSLVRLLEAVARDGEKTPQPRRPWLLVAATLACAFGVGGYIYRQHQLASRPIASTHIVPGAWLETRQDQKMPMHFSEGSEVVVSEASRVRVGSVDPRGADVVVERGSVHARITHRRDTRWSFAAGPFNVRVTGTVLGVDWRPERQEFVVYVDEGSVVAQGPMFGSGRVVSGGESCSVQVKSSKLVCSARKRESGVAANAPNSDTETSELRPSELSPASALSQVSTVTPPASVRAVGPAPNAGLVKLRALERAGKYAEALGYAEGLGISRLLNTASPEELFCLSRLGRYQGKPSLSSDALAKIRSRFARTKEAAIAAFLLGRQASPETASNWFRTYLAEQPQGAFAREAEGRLVESLHNSGRTAEAEAAARRYLSAYPSGPHAGFAKSLLANP